MEIWGIVAIILGKRFASVLRNEIRQNFPVAATAETGQPKPSRRDVCVTGFAGLRKWTAELNKPQLACG